MVIDSLQIGVRADHQGKGITTMLGFLIGNLAYRQGFSYMCILTTTTLGGLLLQKTAHFDVLGSLDCR
jgi:hypothetical protein